jgi:hypothetical protein
MKRQIALVLMIALAGCESAEERCNATKVAMSDAWELVHEALAPQCGLFDDRWTEVHREALRGLDRMFVGRASRWEWVAGSIAICMEQYQPVLGAACRAVPMARTRSTGGAVAARDAARSADEALDSLLAAHSTFASCMAQIVAEEATDPQEREARELARPFVDAARAHSEAIGGSAIQSLRDAARTASEASFTACQTVDP